MGDLLFTLILVFIFFWVPLILSFLFSPTWYHGRANRIPRGDSLHDQIRKVSNWNPGTPYLHKDGERISLDQLKYQYEREENE